MATYQLAPPVWVIARKCDENGVDVELPDHTTLYFKPYSLVLCPNFIF